MEMPNGKAGFSQKNKGIKLATVVGGSVPSHHSSTSTNQWISQIVALTLRTKSVSKESVFFTQKTTPTRAFLRNCTRAKSQSYSFGHPVNLLYTVNRLFSRPYTRTLASKNNPSLRYLYLK